MRKCLFILLLCGSALGQGSHRLGQVLVKGNGINANVGPYASIQVCTPGTQCGSLATIYSSQALTSKLTQPVVADGSGNYDYYLTSGCVDELVSAPGQSSYYIYNVCPGNGQVSTPYTLPAATTTTLGGVKPDGTTITVNAGVISSSSAYTLPSATTTVLGGVKPDGSTCTTTNGVLTCPGSGGANFASPPALGNTTPNTVYSTLSSATSSFVQGTRTSCSILSAQGGGGKGCLVVNMANDTGWTPGAGALTLLSLGTTQTGPGMADASVTPRIAEGLFIGNNFTSPSITNDFAISSNKIASGDYLPLNVIAFQRGAWSEHSDQGYNGIFFTGGNPLGHPSYTIGTGGTGATTVVPTGAPSGCYLGSYGGDTCKRIAQGSFLLDINNAPVATTILSPSTTFPSCPWLQQIAVTAASLPAASTWGCATGVNAPTGILPNAPQAFTFTLTAGSGLFTAGQHVTVGGSNHYEQTTITSVTGTTAGAQTITLPLAYPNTSVSIWANGVEGKFLSTDAVYSASGGSYRSSYPVMGNTDTGTIIYEIPQQGEVTGFKIPRGTGDPTTTDGTASAAIHLYCGARVSNVSDFNNPNTYTLEPNKCTWIPGNTMEQPDFPSQFVAGMLMEAKMNAPGQVEGIETNIGGFGAAGSAFAYDAGNENTPCFQSGGGCVGTNILPPIGAYAVGVHGNTGVFNNTLYTALAPFNAVITVNSWNTAQPVAQTGVNVISMPGGYMRYNGAGASGGRNIPYQWRFDSDGAESVRASFYQFNKDGLFALGIAPSANAAIGTTFDPATGFVTPGGVLEVGNVILKNLTAGTAALCANGTGGAITNVGCAAGTGTGGVGGSGTTGYLPVFTATATVGNSPLDYNVTGAGVLTSTVPFQVKSTSTPSQTTWVPNGVTPAVPASGSGFGVAATVTAPSRILMPDAPATGIPYWTNSAGLMTTSILGVGAGLSVVSGNLTATGGIANTQVSLATTAIAANACTAALSVTMTGMTTTSVISSTFATDPTAVNGWGNNGGLVFATWPTANTLNYRVCNQTTASITPGAMTMNVGAK